MNIVSSMSLDSLETIRPKRFTRSLTEKFQDVKRENPKAGKLHLYFLFAGRLVSILFRLMLASLYLRKCNKVGKLTSTNGRPLIKNKGTIEIGNNVAIWSIFDRTKFLVHTDGLLKIGSNSRINGVHISVKNAVIIGENVRIGPYTLIMDSDFHDVYDRTKEGKKGAVKIGNDVWIASKVTILKGVEIGEGSMIAAGSVVVKNVPPYTLAAGVPARVIKDLRADSKADNNS